MSSKLELDIQVLLLEYTHPDLVADRILRQWENLNLTQEDINTIGAFLFNAGFYPTLLSQSIKALIKKKPVPWKYLAESLSYCDVSQRKLLAEALIQGAEEHKKLNDLVLSRALDSFDSKLLEIRKKLESEKVEKIQEKKERGLEKIQIFRHQRLLQEEQKTLKELMRYFPNDTEILKEMDSYESRWAQTILENKSYHSLEKNNFLKPHDSTELLHLKKNLLPLIFSLAKEKPYLAYDLSLMAYWFDDSQSAFEILQFAPASNSKSWLELEYLLESQRFVDALQYLVSLEHLNVQDPEIVFAISYYRAQCLWGLHQFNEAIHLMEDIEKIRPQYRATHAFLLEWTRRDP